ncbi:cation diffusion facilitator family transporter [Mucilaginibacter sp. CAU 1740]|uniref:cation diffusion facilitator family transporter n=1 Tax=Mucilaginibacter sp. CAU 1740 TaxID=3140365 RepID=UPI00325BFB35
MPASKTPIYTALAANLLIAAAKLTAALLTGSSAMASEGIHSLVDTSNEVLLLYGMRRSRLPPDEHRPFGYGKELYFWAFVVSLLFFALGGGFSIYEGIHHLLEPEPVRNPEWNYAILGFALIFDGISLITALREFNRQRGGAPFWQAVKQSKDPSTFVVLFEDAADVTGILLAFTGIALGQYFHNPYADGIASILIGLLLTFVAIFLVRESRSLLMGETASPQEVAQIIDLVQNAPGILQVSHHQSMYLSPEEVMLQLQVRFRPGLNSEDLVATTQQLRLNIQQLFPHFQHIAIEAV